MLKWNRCLREYSGRPCEKEQKEIADLPVEIEPKGDTPQPYAASEQKQPATQPQEVHDLNKPKEHPQLEAKQEEPLRHKNADTVDYVVGSPPEREAAYTGGGGGGGTGQEGCSLRMRKSPGWRKRAESLRHANWKEWVSHQLRRCRRAIQASTYGRERDGEELRVEVKAHSGRATVVDVTQREYKEYLGQQGYHWELWNVEHLAENDGEPVAITRFVNIPDDALDVRMFQI